MMVMMKRIAGESLPQSVPVVGPVIKAAVLPSEAVPAFSPPLPVVAVDPKPMPKSFDEAFKSWLAGFQKISDDYMEAQFPSLSKPVFKAVNGIRYVKVIGGGSVKAFVDKQSGDVLKPASWKAPAKHARGNIFDKWNGLKMMGPYGPAYLK